MSRFRGRGEEEGGEGGKTLPNFGHQSCWAVWLAVSVGKCQWRWSLISFNIFDPVSEFYQYLSIRAVEVSPCIIDILSNLVYLPSDKYRFTSRKDFCRLVERS